MGEFETGLGVPAKWEALGWALRMGSAQMAEVREAKLKKKKKKLKKEKAFRSQSLKTCPPSLPVY